MSIFYSLNTLADKAGSHFQSLVLLLLRLYVASVFLKSGVQKLSNWDSTLYLFEYEYSVPLLPANIAAIMGTAAEIILPILLIFGLLTRLTALATFVFNIIAVASYSALSAGEWSITTAFGFLPTGIGFPTKGFEDHVVWGMILLAIFAFGAGRSSLDNLLESKGKAFALVTK